MQTASQWPRWLALAGLAVGVLLASLAGGAAAIGLADLRNVLAGGGTDLARVVVLELRLPRALAGFAVGGSLALAGLLLQALFRNPLADPYVLGVSGGASVGALLAMAGGLGTAVGVTAGAGLGALAAGLIVFGLGARLGPERLLLVGVVVAAGCGAAVTLLLALADGDALRGMVFWLAGDLSQVHGAAGPLALAAIAAVAAAVAGPPLDVLASGDVRARTVGLDTSRWRWMAFGAAALLSAAAVVTAGTIGFVGLMGAHGARLLLGPAGHRRLAPAAALLGGSFVAAADLVARTALEPRQLPVGGVIALIGAPMFLLLLRRVAR
jgi:iron complex transport system permease protein